MMVIDNHAHDICLFYVKIWPSISKCVKAPLQRTVLGAQSSPALHRYADATLACTGMPRNLSSLWQVLRTNQTNTHQEFDVSLSKIIHKHVLFIMENVAC